MGKKPGFIDPDDEKLKKGQKQLIEDSANWRGPSHKERQQEREVKKAMKNRGKRDVEKVSWKQRAGGMAFLVGIFGIGLFSFVTTVLDFVVGNGIVNLDVQDTANLKKVLFGGEPWLIYCVNNQTIDQRLPQVLEESARTLWSNLGLSVGVLNCWDQTSSGRSVAQRFKLNLKPPLAFVVANGNKPRVLGMTGLSKTEDIEKRVKPALALEAYRIDTLKKWPSLCTSRRSCVVVGHKHQAQKTTAMNVLEPLQTKYRALKMVTLDTSFWQLKLEEGLVATRQNKGGADVVCLTREEATGGGNVTFGGFFLQSLDSSSASSFLQACSDHTGVVQIKAAPRIKARPSKPKKAEPSPAPRPASRPSKPSPPPPRKAAKVDQVGSRAALESEDEPLFEAVEEGEEEAGAEGAEEEEEDEGDDEEVEL